MISMMDRSEEMIEVSIILPVFNRAHLIAESIESVLVQSFRSFELIIIDDGSTDSTVDVINTIVDPRIVLLTQENFGRSVARNKGLAIARGRYIAFLDSDDVYLEGKISLQVAYLNKNPQYGMVYTSAYCIDGAGNYLVEQPYFTLAAGDIYKQIAFFQPLTITLPTVMLRREVLDDVGCFDEEMERFEDTDLWRRISKRQLIGAIDTPTCLLRTHENNFLVSQDPKKILAGIDYYVKKIFRDDSDVDPTFLAEGACRLYEYYGRALLSVPGWSTHGIYAIRKAIYFRPARLVSILASAFRAVIGSFVRQRFGSRE